MRLKKTRSNPPPCVSPCNSAAEESEGNEDDGDVDSLDSDASAASDDEEDDLLGSNGMILRARMTVKVETRVKMERKMRPRVMPRRTE